MSPKTALPVPARAWAESAADAMGDDFTDLAVMHLEAPAYVAMEARETPARARLALDIEAAFHNYVAACLKLE